MILRSTNDARRTFTFAEAVDCAMPDDRGLFLPASFPLFTSGEISAMRAMNFQEVALSVGEKVLREDLPQSALVNIIHEAFTFPVPLRPLDNHTVVLELFHGPTLAFKDVGARFMARVVAYLHRNDDREITVLVATSGDTGSAVAHGFHGVSGTKVVLLYPSGMVSKIQEQQMTTLGGNVTALEVQGTFDDCQRLVKEALADPDLRRKRSFSSANSINIARLLPQSFYYFAAYAGVGTDGESPAVSVPSGNLGNLTAGLFAWKMGLPVRRFIAATNVNDSLPRYLATGKFAPKPTIPTISNAMDVGNPSNFARVRVLFDDDCEAAGRVLHGVSCTDGETKQTIRSVFDRYGYVLDPHGAVACGAWESYSRRKHEEGLGIVLATAHPAKFIDIYDAREREAIVIPDTLKRCLSLPKHSTRVSSRYDDLKSILSN
jgi:threonine synthase